MFLQKGHSPNWSEEVFVIKTVENTGPWAMLLMILMFKKSFYKKELLKTNQKEFRIKKVLKKKGDKLYVKWKGYNNSFNSWTDKKDIL